MECCITKCELLVLEICHNNINVRLRLPIDGTRAGAKSFNATVPDSVLEDFFRSHWMNIANKLFRIVRVPLSVYFHISKKD